MVTFWYKAFNDHGFKGGSLQFKKQSEMVLLVFFLNSLYFLIVALQFSQVPGKETKKTFLLPGRPAALEIIWGIISNIFQ